MDAEGERLELYALRLPILLPPILGIVDILTKK